MRTIGLDLAVQTAHKAVVLDEGGHFCTPILTVHTRPSELSQLLAQARDGASSAEVQIVMEPTGMAWFPVAVYHARQAGQPRQAPPLDAAICHRLGLSARL